MKRKLAKYLILISLVFFTSQLFSQSQIKLLERAYKENSDSLMKVFFQNWKKDLPTYPLSTYEYSDDTLKEIVELYKLFYLPQKLDLRVSKALKYYDNDELSGIDSNNFTILKPDFFPNDLECNIVERVLYFQWYEDPQWNSYEPDNLRRDTLKVPEMARAIEYSNKICSKIYSNFRPEINNREQLFLDSNYIAIINYFLTGSFLKKLYVKLDFLINENSFKRLYDKIDFLNKYYPVYLDGFYDEIPNEIFRREALDVQDYSEINSIYFDKSMKYSIVRVSGNRASTSYISEKTSNGWIIRDKGILWID